MPLAATLRTRLLWAVMRGVDYRRLEALHDGGRLRPLERVLLRGELVVLGGLAPGVRLAARHFEPWGAQAYPVLTGTHEPMVQEALRRSLLPGGVLLDVGANIGATALLAARLLGPGGRVVALDAQRECVEAVRENAALNGLDGVRALHVAASDASGEAEVIVSRRSLWTRLATVGDHPLEVRRDHVRTATIDDLVRDGEIPVPDVVKVDVEGAELAVVEGMAGLLADRRPVLIVEMHGKNAAFGAAMDRHGYRVTNLDGPEPVAEAGDNVHAFCEPR